METSIPTLAEAEKLNLTSNEFDRIREILKRSPNALELEVFSLLWSEHASYKNSLKWLKTLPTQGEKVLVGAGKESSGAIDLGNGLACVVKIESHNHPCAIQPRLGANTGLRIVTRDVASMGAKPVAILNSLRLGDGKRDTARWLFDEISKGMCEFEKGYQVPIIGGETYFSKGYNSSPVINNYVVGVVESNKILSGVAKGKGNVVLVIGAPTGKDGIDDDVFTSDSLAGVDTKPVPIELLMDVSVEKQLQDAILLMNKENLLLGAENIASHGIIGTACEMAARGDSTIKLHLEEVPTREEGLTARDLMLAQSWSRMMVCVEVDKIERIKEITDKHSLSMGVVGEVDEGETVECFYKDELVASIPARYVGLGGEAPVYDLEYSSDGMDTTNINLDQFDEPDHYPDVVKKMMNNLNVVSKNWMSDKFDQSLCSDGDYFKYPSDATYVDLEGTEQALTISVDCNPSYMTTDPFKGAQIAVAEACRNIVCGGGIPLGVSDCLNFGNPNDKSIYGTFIDSIKGITKACNDYGVSVLSGNVSFFNQRSEEGQLKPITPTPVIGMVGLLESKHHHCTLSFRHKGDMIFLVGKSRNDVNSSEFATSILNIKKSIPPFYYVDEEKDLQNAVSGMIRKDLVRSVHDVSNGGLFFTLLECGIPLEFGFDITSDAEIRKEAFLFGESQSRVVVSVSSEKQDDFVDFMMETGVPFSILGHVTKGEIRIDDESYGYIDELKKSFEQRLGNWVEGK
ncbi:phosphoribosylformylglycinamidine synthase subunit PurL [Carboxylicivirga linearis]|uniref:Phosphoribosylformylglycinamidine synthase subunit PurL n=1 Tax=Carboxylicivirga linearis TaxID=1628157 RepID=A0ABS5JZ64_9BACT|nr:phosphoribosylformylglycinamidine synthase subunit PurL [Carboxylicivirga linearis]MBS2100129.1 phosphoribosylformylglycinamidine synthase subunit PurL [Carboxylicivirga linearis]